MRRWALLVLVIAVTSACGIRPDAAPRPLSDDEGEIVVVANPSAATAAGAERIYLVAPGEERLLKSVPRTAVSRDDLIKVLLLGPNPDEQQAQYSSAIPPDTRLLSARSRGQLLVLDITEDITDLTGPALTQALAQIVYTATELDGIEAVQIDVDGTTVGWLTPTGETKTVLRVYDFPNAAATAQPDYPALPGDAT